jgi:hypothetical protein
MKINYNQYTVLKCLENKSLNGIGFHPLDGVPTYETTQMLSSYFKNNNLPWRMKVNYISKSFQDAITKSFSSLIRDEVWDDIGAEHGTILNMLTPMGEITCCYSINSGIVKGHHIKTIMYFYKDMWLGLSVQDTEAMHCVFSNSVKVFFDDFFKKLGQTFNERDLINEIDNVLYTFLISHINFIKYAEVQTDYLPPNNRIKSINCKYINDTNSMIRLLTSKWFTTLVQSEAFNVRGHFRLQPVGEGRKDRKLIWVNDFQKNGYTSKAQILTEEFTTPIN